MATKKAYSVAQTAKQYGGTAVQSDVYSITPIPDGDGIGSEAYGHASKQGLTEGRSKTLLNGSRAVVNHDVTAIKGVTTAGTTAGFSSATRVVATTTTLTGTGAGLIVSFTTTAAGVANGTPGNYTVEDGGEGYATDDTVRIDGFPGSVLAVTAA